MKNNYATTNGCVLISYTN